ncbi:CBPA5 Carboxypeptidase, partial [Pitta sordida]|nr:CBPA5 Carboxypeptidase [Pitta sordida]
DQVLRVVARDEEQISQLRLLGERDELQVDFWRHPTSPSGLADLRVPFRSLRAVKAFLGSRSIPYTTMIEDVQELLDEEKQSMLRSRRIKRSSRGFDFASYHTIDEV